MKVLLRLYLRCLLLPQLNAYLSLPCLDTFFLEDAELKAHSRISNPKTLLRLTRGSVEFSLRPGRLKNPAMTDCVISLHLLYLASDEMACDARLRLSDCTGTRVQSGRLSSPLAPGWMGKTVGTLSLPSVPSRCTFKVQSNETPVKVPLFISVEWLPGSKRPPATRERRLFREPRVALRRYTMKQSCNFKNQSFAASFIRLPV